MKIHDIKPFGPMAQLNEAVEVHGRELLAYVLTVAEAFYEAPTVEDHALILWRDFLAEQDAWAKRLFRHIQITYVDDDPYDNEEQVIRDVIMNRRLFVFRTGADYQHDAWTAEQNNVFRALHDVMSHVGGSSRTFNRFLKQYAITHADDPKLGLFRARTHNFTIRGELSAYLKHARMTSPRLLPVLFTEIVGQACAYFSHQPGQFVENKVAELDGFDPRRIGRCSGHRARRMADILAQYDDPHRDVIELRLRGGVRFDKNRIDWPLLSTGTGAGRIT